MIDKKELETYTKILEKRYKTLLSNTHFTNKRTCDWDEYSWTFDEVGYVLEELERDDVITVIELTLKLSNEKLLIED